MIERLIESLLTLDSLRKQPWGMVTRRVKLAQGKGQPGLSRTSSLLDTHKMTGDVVVRFDPSLEDAARWELVSIDGSAPDSKSLAAHTKRYTGREAKMPIERLPAINEMVPQNTIKEIGEEGGYLVASFVPKLTLPIVGDLASKLVGRIWYNIDSDHIESIIVQNEKKITPVPGLAISELHLGLKFDKVDGEPVMLESELMVSGKKLFKSFQEISRYEYSEHRLVEIDK